MRYYIYCDESVQKGDYYSNFYGGVLINSKDFELITAVLDAKRKEVIRTNEMKWQKINQYNYKSYIDALDLFFDFVQANTIKVRIMFTRNKLKRNELVNIPNSNLYMLLYYQFIKNAFGLQYLKGENNLHIFLDNLPHNDARKEQFKKFIYGIQFLYDFLNSDMKINRDEISEVNSANHILIQYLDVVLGATSHRLNKKHLVKDKDTNKPGKRTLAKKIVYKHIYKRIKDIYPGFNIAISTDLNDNIENLWHYPYMHWLLVPENLEMGAEIGL